MARRRGGGALDLSNVFPMVWAQSTNTLSTPPPSPALRMAELAFRRWCGSLTLSQPDGTPGALSPSLWAWLIGLGVLMLISLVVQGPGRAIGQLLDVPGHARLLGAALDRFRRSGRMLAAVVGSSVLVWTTNQSLSYGVATGRDDMILLTKGRSLSDVALNQGYLAAMTPLRDVVSLSLQIPLLVAVAIVLFQFSTNRWGSGVRIGPDLIHGHHEGNAYELARFSVNHKGPPSYLLRAIRQRLSSWSTIGWGSVSLYAVYRFVSLVTGNSEIPLGGCLGIEAPLIPILMALADGVVVAWVIVELRNAGLGDLERDSLDVVGTILLIPASVVGCVLIFPARYMGTAAWLTLLNLPPAVTTGSWVGTYLRWQLGWGLIDLQGLGIVFTGFLGAVAWSRGTPGDAFKGYFRILSNEGGHLVAALAAGGAAAGAVSALAYMLILSLPASTWALSAADSYAHYATIPVGLLILAAVIELGERSLPSATLANPALKESLA